MLGIRKLMMPGVNDVDFGPSDLSFDLETHPNSRLQTVEDCMGFVTAELKGVDVRIM